MSEIVHWLPWFPAALYVLGALLAALPGRHAWQALGAATRAAFATAAIVAAITVHESALPALVGLLIAFLGWIIGDFAHRYLRGEPGQSRFAAAFLATLAAVSAVVCSQNLVALILAWSASSIALHHLLTFYPDRRAALVVAHKKFLASRLAELCLVAAAILLFHCWGTFSLAEIGIRARESMPLPAPASIAAVLIAIAATLRCAQLPLHGWIIQVMEAPTPVSALLHAGVVNLGGYVLIRLAPLISASQAAQALLVVVGGLTAVLAGLVMLTRVTIKVRLAWSTCSQMGFMLLECGLGLYDLALLHLLAHSLYKAHAFLTSGGAVREALQGTRTPHGSPLWSAPALAVAAAIALGSALAWHRYLGVAEPPAVALALLSFGLATLLWNRTTAWPDAWRGLARAVLMTQVYLAWHWLLSLQLGLGATPAPVVLSAGALVAFSGLYILQATLPNRLYDWVYAGFYLDERFTRLAFRIWPVTAGQPRAGTPDLDAFPREAADER